MDITVYPKIYAAIGKTLLSIVIVLIILFAAGVIDRTQMLSYILVSFSIAGLAIFGVGAMHEDARRKKLIEQGKDPYSDEDE